MKTKTTDKPVTVGATTYQRIKRDIIFGALEPGRRLKLDDLRVRYATSLSTLRETLNRLASEGFARAEEQRGFFVSPVSKEDLAEIAELRILLECAALRTSLRNGDTEWEGDLASAYHKLQRLEALMSAGDAAQVETWKRYDWEFHLATITACNSANLLALHATVFDKYLRYQLLVLTNRGETAAAEHRAMFDAALARDVDAAERLLEQHVRNGLAHTLDAM